MRKAAAHRPAAKAAKDSERTRATPKSTRAPIAAAKEKAASHV